MSSGPVLGMKARKPAALPTILSGRYLPISELGRGALGEVYLARDVTCKTRVAIKVMRGSLAEKEKARDLMFNESRALSSFDHHGIPKLIEYNGGSRPYTVMDYMKGVPMGLKALSSRTRKEFVRLCIDVLGILEEVHSKGIVHRDLKPPNILIDPESMRPSLIDFTHSKIPGLFDYAESSPVPMGTPAFMSPEQTVRGMKVDARSDVYSFGVLMYMFLAGRTPFIMRDSHEEVMRQHRLVYPVPLELVDESIPRALSMAVSIAMNKMPEDRFQSAGDMRKALERIA